MQLLRPGELLIARCALRQEDDYLDDEGEYS
jgi:hypothetical protein